MVLNLILDGRGVVSVALVGKRDSVGIAQVVLRALELVEKVAQVGSLGVVGGRGATGLVTLGNSIDARAVALAVGLEQQLEELAQVLDLGLPLVRGHLYDVAVGELADGLE